MKHIVLLSTDLMLASAAQGIADRHGAELTSVSSVAEATAACEAAGEALAVFDLRTPGLNVAEAAAAVRERSGERAFIVACAPHVHTQSLAAAAEAGCDAVITRGEFERRIEALVDQLAGGG